MSGFGVSNQIYLILIILLGDVLIVNTKNSSIVERFVKKPTNRQERVLIFNKGGQVRLICGFLAPTFIPIWQNINVLTNFAVGFLVPTNAADWLSKFSGNSNWARYKQSRDLHEFTDTTRQKFYHFIEKQFNKWGRNGHECLLRTICEVAEAPIKHNGLLGEVFHIIFTPGEKESVAEDYKAAKRAGFHGVDCYQLFNGCPYGHGFLEKYSVLGLFTSKSFLNAFF